MKNENMIISDDKKDFMFIVVKNTGWGGGVYRVKYRGDIFVVSFVALGHVRVSFRCCCVYIIYNVVQCEIQ